MNTKLLDYIERDPESRPLATVIWLHGLGADGYDFEPIVPELNLPSDLPVRFVFPHAPERPVTINAGMVMRAWYDIIDISGPGKIDRNDFFESVELLEALIQHECDTGVPSDHIMLAGFSQGGAIALYTGLRYKKALAGIMALSTHLSLTDALSEEASPANREIPIMMAHGTMDPTIPLGNAIRTRQTLKQMGYKIRWHEYPIGHQVCAEEIQDIRAWLLNVVKNERQS
jgi:phospholipase/carboxylesterase